MVGLHRCHPGFLETLVRPPSFGSMHPKYNVLEELRDRWSGSSSSGTGLTGSTRWESKNVVWLLLYIVSELDGTPYCHRSPDIQKAYIPIVRHLVSRLSLKLGTLLITSVEKKPWYAIQEERVYEISA